MALDGDFIDVFRFFLESGQSERESFQSTARVFRGGDVRGRHAFTKDVVYLKGLISVHNFLVSRFSERKFNYLEHLFLGRLSLPDIISLREFIVGPNHSATLFAAMGTRVNPERSDAHIEPDLRVLVSPKAEADLPK